jgi:hypothetical protein
MTTCPGAQPAPLRCPTLEESIAATVALLPRGRSFPVNDGGGTIQRFLVWLAALAGAVPAAWPIGYVQAGFFSALGAVRNYVETRLCALRLEFWCATESETNDLWMREYGLPDACDPFPDLCTKVAAIGGATCDYLNSIIARIGWTAQCFDMSAFCGSRAGCALAGDPAAMAGDSSYLGLKIIVHTGDPVVSPIISGSYVVPRAGVFLAGQMPSCDTVETPSVEPVRCLMDRIAPAHVQIEYVP